MHIKLYGHIQFDGSTLSQFAAQLDEAQGPVTIEICSYGGCVSSAVAMYNLIRARMDTVTTIANGFVASSAILILAAGDKRLSYPNTTFLIHPFSSEIRGTGSEMFARAQQTKREQDMCAKLIAEACEAPFEDIQKLFAAESYFDIKTAKKLGLVRRIL